MSKQYIRLHDVLDTELRKLQGTLIRTFLVDVSYNTVVNMVILAGLVAADKLDKNDWRMVKQYWYEEDERVVSVRGKADVMASQLEAA